MPPSSHPPATHFEALDGWRGICACLLVLFHFPGHSPIYSSPLVRHSYLFVDFFFVLSGFVIAWNYTHRLDSWPGVKRFLFLRLGRVYPLHLFMLLCFVAFEAAKLASDTARLEAFTGEREPVAVLTHLLLVQSLHLHDSLTWNAPSWSISTELWAYVVFALVSLWFGMRNWMLLATAAVAPLVLHQVAERMDITYDYGLIRCVFGFAMGIACCRIHRAWPRRSPSSGLAAPTAVECLVVAAVVLFVALAGDGAWSLLAPFVFAPAVLVFAAERGLLSRVLNLPLLKWLGTLSYSIYLTHYLIVLKLPVVVKQVLHEDLWTQVAMPSGGQVPLFGRTDAEGTFFYAVVMGLTLAFSALTYRWVETPGRDWSRRWMSRREARAAATIRTRAAALPGNARRSSLAPSHREN